MHLVLLCTRYLFYICVHENMIPYQRKKSIDAFKWHCVDLVGNVYYTLCTQLLSRVGTWQLAGPTFFIAFVFCPVCCRGAGHFCTIDWWCGASMSFQWEAPRPAFVWPQTQWLVTHCSSSLLLLTAPPHCSSSLLLTAPHPAARVNSFLFSSPGFPWRSSCCCCCYCCCCCVLNSPPPPLYITLLVL